jgi:thiosulfate/3-mercaptopyruvate sulfurtransferase
MSEKPDSKLLVSAAELAAADMSSTRIFDCRFDLADPGAGKRAYVKEHIPGALYADLDQDLAGPVVETSGRHPLPDKQAFAERLREWGVDSDSHVIAYDDAGGAFAARLWWMLKWVGQVRCSLLDGGMQAWRSAGLPLAAGVEVAAGRGDFAEAATSMPLVTSDQLRDSLGREDLKLLDARAHARFRGEHEPIDAVAGHVPGATCVPFTDHLDDAGQFRSKAELGKLYDGLNGTGTVCMCDLLVNPRRRMLSNTVWANKFRRISL